MLSTPILRLLLVFAALLLLTDTAAACLCLGPRQVDSFHPCLTYWNADAVFTGLAEEVSLVDLNWNGKRGLYSEKVVRFSVDEAFVDHSIQLREGMRCESESFKLAKDGSINDW